MCEVKTYSRIQVNAYDPTRTTTLRNAFVRNMNKRFRDLTRVIREAIVRDDCFGLAELQVNQLSSPGYHAFNFPRSADKVKAFMQWLIRQENAGILETVNFPTIGGAGDPAWTDIYIYDSYKRGIMRGRSELIKAGYKIPSIEASGGIEAVLGTPMHIDAMGLLYTRTFEELKGITNAMDQQISRILAQGIADGDGPGLLARKLVATIDGSGRGTLGLTDSLGRSISPKVRAQTLARTETIRAHHTANMNEYKAWGTETVEVIAEFITAGDDRVCSECISYHGSRFTMPEAEHLIPVHPNCRCIVIPVATRTIATGETADLF